MKIVGMHYCYPSKVLDNAELAIQFGDEAIDRIEKMTGIESRRVGGDAVELAYYAARHLLEAEGVDPKSVKAIVLVTQTGTYRIPANACILHGMLKLSQDCVAFDMNLGCSGFPYGLMVMSGIAERLAPHEYVLLLNAEGITKFLDQRSRGLRCIHGDGATATLLKSSTMKMITFGGTDGTGWNCIQLGNHSDDKLFMDGPAVAHFATRVVPELIVADLKRHSLTVDHMDLVLLHQANRSLVLSIYDELGVPPSKRHIFISHVGNTASASTPMLLANALRLGKVDPETHTLVYSFGNGLSWGGAVIEWGDVVPSVSGPTELDELITLYGELSYA